MRKGIITLPNCSNIDIMTIYNPHFARRFDQEIIMFNLLFIIIEQFLLDKFIIDRKKSLFMTLTTEGQISICLTTAQQIMI